jgi:hypothetical protein
MHPRGERSPRLLENGFGDRYTTTASAEVVGSWIKRLSHHHMTPCELWDAQSPGRRLNRLVLRFRCTLGESARHAVNESGFGDRWPPFHDHGVG